MQVFSVALLSGIKTGFLQFFPSVMPQTFINRVQILKNIEVSPIAFVEESRKISSLLGKNDISMMDLLSFLKM